MTSPKTVITVAAVQDRFTGDHAGNVERMAQRAREAAALGAQVILLPELFEGPYFPSEQHERHFERAAPAADHPTVDRFRALAAELGAVIPVSFFERDGQAFYNSAAMIDADGAVLGIYRKSHIPDGPGYQEKFYFRPGDTGFRCFRTAHGAIGVGICWDQWFPEAARAMVLAGADILLYPTAIGSEPEHPHIDTKDPWQRVMIGHAVANACAVVAANRVGQEQAATFYGHSFIANHRGDKLAEMSTDDVGVITATIDTGELQRERASFGFFRDRRPELYGPLTRVGPDRGEPTDG